jgi:hypothetical protein
MIYEGMDNTLTLIRLRRQEIAKQRETAQRTIETLDKEDGELAAAERVIVRLSGAFVATTSGASVGNKLTQREAVLLALRSSAAPWFPDIEALREEASTIYGKDIPKTTLQPMLSTLTNEDKLVVRDGAKIALAERAKEQAAA